MRHRKPSSDVCQGPVDLERYPTNSQDFCAFVRRGPRFGVLLTFSLGVSFYVTENTGSETSVMTVKTKLDSSQ